LRPSSETCGGLGPSGDAPWDITWDQRPARNLRYIGAAGCAPGRTGGLHESYRRSPSLPGRRLRLGALAGHRPRLGPAGGSHRRGARLAGVGWRGAHLSRRRLRTPGGSPAARLPRDRRRRVRVCPGSCCRPVGRAPSHARSCLRRAREPIGRSRPGDGPRHPGRDRTQGGTRTLRDDRRRSPRRALRRTAPRARGLGRPVRHPPRHGRPGEPAPGARRRLRVTRSPVPRRPRGGAGGSRRWLRVRTQDGQEGWVAARFAAEGPG
jgi:hypothetical protein